MRGAARLRRSSDSTLILRSATKGSASRRVAAYSVVPWAILRGSLRSHLRMRSEREALRIRSQLPQRHFLHQVACFLLQDQMRALTRRHDVFAQIDQVDPLPDRGCGLLRFLVVQAGIAMEVGLRIAERGLA